MLKLNKKISLAIVVMFTAPMYAAEKVAVKIIDRQDNASDYTYMVPGYSSSRSSADASCFGGGSSVNCSGTSRTTEVSAPPQQLSYHVSGATFSLQLPDGRVAVVNCVSKYAPHGDYINRRSCRTPLVNAIEVEFDGDKAKLFWTVSIDGRKKESETYKILAVLDKP